MTPFSPLAERRLRSALVPALALVALLLSAAPAAAVDIKEVPGRTTTDGQDWLVIVVAGGAIVAALVVILLMFTRMGNRKRPARRQDAGH